MEFQPGHQCLPKRTEYVSGMDLQVTRETWYGIRFTSQRPCGYDRSGRGAIYIS